MGLFAAVIMHLLLISAAVGAAAARELRPADHGLEYQDGTPPKEVESPEMMSFFGTSQSQTQETEAPPAAEMALPKATGSPTWEVGGSARGNSDHAVKHVLVVASLACGIAGVALLVAAALIHFLGNKDQKSDTRTYTK